MSWVKCSERMPECNVTTSTWLGGEKCSRWVIAKFPDGELAIRPAIVVSYDDVLVWYTSCDDTMDGGLDRCASHGGSGPTHWIPLPAPPAPETRCASGLALARLHSEAEG